MTPRQFRHFVAALALEAEPDSAHRVKDLLGHRFLQTTRALYGEFEQRRASEAWIAHLDTAVDHVQETT